MPVFASCVHDPEVPEILMSSLKTKISGISLQLLRNEDVIQMNLNNMHHVTAATYYILQIYMSVL